MYISDTYFCQVLTFDYTCFIYFLKKQNEYKKYIAVYFLQSHFFPLFQRWVICFNLWFINITCDLVVLCVLVFIKKKNSQVQRVRTALSISLCYTVVICASLSFNIYMILSSFILFLIFNFQFSCPFWHIKFWILKNSHTLLQYCFMAISFFLELLPYILTT